VISSSSLTSIDLLKIEDVTKLQKRLIELGFFKGPANGTWGPVSRQALRAFKAGNGLPNDDRMDDLTGERLMAPGVSVISLFDVVRSGLFDGLPGSASRAM